MCKDTNQTKGILLLHCDNPVTNNVPSWCPAVFGGVWPQFDLSVVLQEEEDGSEDDGDSKTQCTVTVRPELSVLSYLDHMDEEVDGFITPVDELSPSKHTMDMRLSNLHSATT